MRKNKLMGITGGVEKIKEYRKAAMLDSAPDFEMPVITKL